MQAKTFKALGILLCYPEQNWLEEADNLASLIRNEAIVKPDAITSLQTFIRQLTSRDLLELQEEYVDTFDRVRSLSLHLFEHVHGESRDRGQAMVDLAERYKEQGFALAASELPDYMPVFLEYLSQLPKATALEELAETGHILAALGKRLNERGNPYGIVIDILTTLAGKTPEKVKPRSVSAPTFEQIDKEWEEKPIEFLGADAPQSGGCGSTGCGGGCAGNITSPLQDMTQGART